MYAVTTQKPNSLQNGGCKWKSEPHDLEIRMLFSYFFPHK